MKATTRTFTCTISVFLSIVAAQTALAFYNPEAGRWANRDPIGERGGVNLFSHVGNDPMNYYDPLGLDIVINKTGRPLMASGNLGSGHGAGKLFFAIIPSDGKPHGGTANPVLMYPTKEEAEIAAGIDDQQGPVRAPVPVVDIDYYDDPTRPNPNRGSCNRKIPGDEKGPTTTITIGPQGHNRTPVVVEDKDGVWGSRRRFLLRPFTD